MNKKKKAAIAAVLAYLSMEHENKDARASKKKAYSDLYYDNDSEWYGHGMRNIMAGRKIKIN